MSLQWDMNLNDGAEICELVVFFHKLSELIPKQTLQSGIGSGILNDLSAQSALPTFASIRIR